jgi:hypothetical protein
LDLLNEVRHAVFAELETFGYRRLMGGGGLSVVPIEGAQQVPAFVDLALRLLLWQERFGGDEEWDYDDLQLLAEVFDTESDEWSNLRPEVAGAMRAFTRAAWTVL